MNINDLDKTKCTGCFACASICPKQCINYKKDKEGFLFPFIEESLCIDCGLCLKKCHAYNSYPNFLMKPLKAFGCQRKNNNLLKKSSSGGFASLLSEDIVNNGGVVYGSYLSKDFEVKHIRVNNKNEIYLLSGSKYVQSFTGGIFKNIENDLSKGLIVLFVGTPCQVASLRFYLRNNYTNLYCIDLICHGVPNNDLFKSYIDYLGNEISNYKFRDNSIYNWIDGANVSYTIKGKYVCKSQHIDAYGSSFFWGENYRRCCYNCKYASPNRVGDITIGDFWGFDKLDFKNFSGIRKDGISAIICNSEKGLRIFNSVSHEMHIVESSFDEIANHNPNLTHATIMPKIRETFYKKFKKSGFSWVSKRRLLKSDFYKFLLKKIVPKKLIYFFKKGV